MRRSAQSASPYMRNDSRLSTDGSPTIKGHGSSCDNDEDNTKRKRRVNFCFAFYTLGLAEDLQHAAVRMPFKPNKALGFIHITFIFSITSILALFDTPFPRNQQNPLPLQLDFTGAAGYREP